MCETPSELPFLIRRYAEVFGRARSAVLVFAPGRVNIIGGHVDHALGYVVPMAISQGCWILAGPSRTRTLRVFSENYGDGREYLLRDLACIGPTGHWTDYIVGVCRELSRHHYEIVPSDLLVYSTVPIGAGLGSSAALEVASALALRGSTEIDKTTLVTLCRRAENEFVGVPCGVMDQFSSVNGGTLFLDCKDLSFERLRMPGPSAVIAIDSMVRRTLGASGYMDRIRECEAAVAAVRKVLPGVMSLRDVPRSELELIGDVLPGNLHRLVRHIVTENERVLKFRDAVKRRDLVNIGGLLISSHESSRCDYESSSTELDFLVTVALSVRGVYGSRLTGGGFGGCTVTLLDRRALGEFRRVVARRYSEWRGIAPTFIECVPAPGPSTRIISA